VDIRKICDSVETDVSGRYEEIKGKVELSDFVQMYMSYFGWPEYVKVSETISERSGVTNEEVDEWITEHPEIIVEEYEKSVLPKDYEGFTEYAERMWTKYRAPKDSTPLKDSSKERMSERIKLGVYEKLPLGWAFSEATEADARNYTLFVDVVKAADKSSLAQKIAEFLGAERTAKLAGFLNKELGLGVKSRINK